MRNQPSIRWWPAIAIAVVAALAAVLVWNLPSEHRQDQIMKTMAIGFLTVVLLLAWLLLGSRMPWKRRLAWAAVVLLAGLALSRTVRMHGVSGDVLPILEWRWTATETLPAVAGGAVVAPAAIGPDDYPQFLGPDRTGVLGERRFATDWAATPPAIAWKQPIGAGWSAFAVAGGLAVTQEQRGAEEWVTAYDVDTGALRWGRPIGDAWDDPLGGPGPRATPTLDAGRAFALSGRGMLAALDLASGETLWTVDVAADAGASPPTYGYAGSPLIVGEAVVVSAGGGDGRSLAAYRLDDGRRLWSGGGRPAGYSSPSLARLAGTAQILLFDNEGLTAHAVEDGAELWHVTWHGSTEHTSQPVVLPGDRVFQSSGYGVGGKLFHVTRAEDGAWAVEESWASLGLKAKFANVVYRDGFLYGLDDGILACLDAATGERRWKGGRYGHGQIVLAEDVLVVQSENGFVALVEADPGGFREIARTEALDGKTWNHPALSGTRLFVRNDRQAARIDLPPR